ncbi:MAG TPA: protein kinase [Gemmatimonadaceae bacterium]|jgi:tetratricopeptide (TPR) repeat protein/tRNA A-37 threonylcarbamoyl transferase component Bud32|nr:protein kinase [Gemmatimonadaceae bacterium]
MSDRWERLTDLYHAAVALPADERTALLTEECGDDPVLQADVARMIAAHDRASAGRLAEPPASDTIDRFGPYRILKEIGHGPTSTVYLAARDDGRFKQRVAVKVIEGEMDPVFALERLRSAHQALSSSDHANVAWLIDSGITEDGRPYAVMEYVQGEPIDAYANGRRLSITERLELFVKVCKAVSHAHRRHVNHGALKPTNILVMSTDVPKLLDFGIVAPPDMPQTDICALGGVFDMLLGGGTVNGERRPLRAGLETIALRALATSSDRRYDSVDEFVGDIRRYLESVSDRPRPETVQPAPPAADKRRGRRAIIAWTLVAAAVVALGIKFMPLMTQRRTVSAAPAPVDGPSTSGRVFVADLGDNIGDPALVAALSDAFRVGLAESPAIQIVSGRRAGVKSSASGTIAAAGAGFTISVQLTRGQKDARPATITETAADAGDVMRALGRVAAGLRKELGESASSIAGTPGLEEVTTSSLDALRSYANGMRAVRNGDRAGGIKLLKSAVAADTGFGAAHRAMAAAYDDLGDRAHAADALDHALANQARVPFYDRNQMIGSHAGFVQANYASAVDAYNRILQRYPDDVRALTNLGAVHAARREYAVQESLLVRAITVDSSVSSLYTALAYADLNQGDYNAARRVLDKADRRFPGLRGSRIAAMSLAASKQDWAAAEREARARAAARDSSVALDGVETLANIVMTQGRLAEAEQHFRRVAALGGRGGSETRSLAAAVRIAYVQLRYRHSPAVAISTINTALARYPLAKMDESERPYDEVARLYADAGQPDRALEIITEATRTRADRQRGTDDNRRWTAGAIAMAERRPWEGEIEIHGAAEGIPCPICALPDLARAYEVAGKPDSAIATYERYVHTPWQRRYETDALELGFALKRLGELYQSQNDRTKAAAQYTALLQLWKGADAELEPLLADVRRRLEQTATVASNRD